LSIGGNKDFLPSYYCIFDSRDNGCGLCPGSADTNDPGFKLSDTSVAPVANQHTVCLAIMSKVHGPLEIPFFSKVSLKHAVKALRKMDFKVTKLKVER
jgi:hypothetical protein